MCGRFLLRADPEKLKELLGYVEDEDFPPRYNIAPTQPIAIVRVSQGARHLALVRWGLIPGFVEDPKKFSLLINVRAEGIETKGTTKNAMKYRRCLVPASGFYEWRTLPGSNSGKTREPFWLRPKNDEPVAFAGLWETWSDRASGGEIDSAAIVTTDANAVVRPIHNRMPVVIAASDYGTWLNGTPAEAAELLHPAPDDLFEAVAVSNRVNSYANDDASVLDPPPPKLL
jgi:putative SOS response-associated peptidase YedK